MVDQPRHVDICGDHDIVRLTTLGEASYVEFFDVREGSEPNAVGAVPCRLNHLERAIGAEPYEISSSRGSLTVQALDHSVSFRYAPPSQTSERSFTVEADELRAAIHLLTGC